jgi:class 3 adenylate cyclase
MQCSRCQADNKDDRRFCSSCGAPLVVHCPSCNFANDGGAVFCGGCGTSLPQSKGADSAQAVPPAYASPKAYTPAHLADRIIGGRAALEGERKQVTVLFADLKGSMELLADRDPEEARQLLDPVLERMMEAVHRYEGMVNEVRFGRYGTPRDQLRPARLAAPMLIATSWTNPLNTQFARSVGATNHELTDNLSMARGSHLLKIGWNLRFGRQSNNTQGDNGTAVGIYPNVLFGRTNAPVASSIPAQLQRHEPASARVDTRWPCSHGRCVAEVTMRRQMFEEILRCVQVPTKMARSAP